MSWSAEKATRELLQILPLLNRIVGGEIREVAGEDTTMSQFRVMAQLDIEPLTISTLAKRRRVSLQSMSGLAQILVERGWVDRTPDPRDRRQQILQLTARGKDHYEQAQAHILQRLLPLMAELNSAELGAVEKALPALGRVLTQEDRELATAGLEDIQI